jgi:hypothetical protein
MSREEKERGIVKARTEARRIPAELGGVGVGLPGDRPVRLFVNPADDGDAA